MKSISKLFILSLCLIFFVACQKKEEAPKPASTNNSHAVSNKEDYELQERCGKNAKEFFKREYGSGSHNTEYGQEEATYTNHYNRKLNKCFSMTTVTDYVYKDNRPEYARSYAVTVIDINENREYGRVHYIYGKATPIFCQVEGKTCQDNLEWELLIKPYMTE